MKILLITYSFPPLWEAQSIRWYYLSKHLANLGCEVDIVSADFPLEDEDLYAENINIHRISLGLFEYILFRFKNKINLENEESRNFRTKPYYRILKTSYRLFRRFFEYIFLGDVRTEWLPYFIAFYIKHLRKKINTYDVVLCAHEPLVDLLIALFLRKLHPSLKIAVDMADPLTAPYYPPILRPFLKQLEKKILNEANLVIVTNELLKKNYLRKYNVKENKIVLVSQGFDESLLKNLAMKDTPKDRSKNKEKYIKLFYAGSFYPFRNPQNFFNALRRFSDNVKFYYAGRHGNYLPKDLIEKNRIIYLGVLPHNKVLKLASEMDILVYISNKNSMQIPGKLYEYLGFKKPIFCITYNDKDPAADLIKELNIGLVASNDEEDIYDKLNALINLVSTNNFKLPECIDEKIIKFSWENQAKILLSELRRFENRKDSFNK